MSYVQSGGAPRPRSEVKATRYLPAILGSSGITAIGFVMSQTTDWSMIGVFVGAAGLIATLITLGVVAYDVFRPERRKRQIAKPAEAFFLIPAADSHRCDYAHQDDEEHAAKEIILPSYSDLVVDLRINPKTNFTTRAVYFGCIHAPLDERPYAYEYFNQFIKNGPRRHVTPISDRYEDFISATNHYYAVEHLSWSEGISKSMGFKIKTGAPGRYKAKVYFAGDAVMGESDLTIKVSDLKTEVIYCKTNGHEHKHCAAGIRLR